PRAARLAVTAGGDAEDALDVVVTGSFAAVELGHAFVPAQVGEVHGRAGLHAVIIGVVADLVFLQGGDDVGPVAPLQRARLFADDLEGGAHAFAGQEVGDVQRGVVTRRQDVVLGVEPEDDVDARFGVGGQ